MTPQKMQRYIKISPTVQLRLEIEKFYFLSVYLTESSSFLKISNIFLLHHESFQQQFLQYEHRFP